MKAKDKQSTTARPSPPTDTWAGNQLWTPPIRLGSGDTGLNRLLGGLHGDLHAEDRSLPELAREREVTSHHPCEPSADGHAEARTRFRSATRRSPKQ